MTHPSNKKLFDEMEEDSEKLKKELLAIDAMASKALFTERTMESGE